MKENPDFTKWSAEWKEERSNCNSERIVNLWRSSLPQKWERAVWEGALGYRKRSKDRGEQRIEDKLFDRKEGFDVCSSKPDPKPFRLEAIYHNMPLANQQRGQVIADAFGILEIGKIKRPLFIEVKVGHSKPWYALVECLQQVRLARACAGRIRGFVHEKTSHRVEPGIWGLVLAPADYYDKHTHSMDACRALLQKLKEQTHARVAFGVSDYLSSGRIEIKLSNWLRGTGL